MKNSIRTLIWVAALLGAATAHAGSWRVEQDGSGDFTTLQPAIDAAASGDTILVGSGWYQELHWTTDIVGNPIQAAAYWSDEKDLSIIGPGDDTATIGPEIYEPSGFDPQGLFCENEGKLLIQGLTFTNLVYGVLATDLLVSHCTFRNGDVAVYVPRGRGVILDSEFFDYTYSGCFIESDSSRVENCFLSSAMVYFGQLTHGVIQDCSVDGGAMVKYYLADGDVSGNNAECRDMPCVICTSSRIRVFDNSISGGSTCLQVNNEGSYAEAFGNVFSYPESCHFDMLAYGSLLAYDNDIYRESLGPQFFLTCQSYIKPSDAFIDVRNNHWGILDSTEYFLNLRIWDGNDDPDLKIIVDFMPFSTVPLPSEEQSLDGFKSMFR